MKESILHYVWQNKLFFTDNIHTTDNVSVEVIDVGKPNFDAGPDFFNSKIRIGDTVWAGNVEIHTNASDWNKHEHQTDKAYDNVILHVVANVDVDVFRTSGEKISQLVLKYPSYINDNYERLISEQKWIPCEDRIAEVPTVFIENWKSALLTERLEQKTASIKTLLANNRQNWEDAFYVVLARNFGFNTNSQAFEQLAKSLPLSILAKHKDQLLQIEALLFGQSGLLPDGTSDQYTVFLKREYDFLRVKYALAPLDKSIWKLLRLRPDNFPQIRIAQFAGLIYQSAKLFSKIIEKPEIKYLRTLFSCETSEYWETHYTFERTSTVRTKKMSRQTVDILLINTVVPFLFCYGESKQNQTLRETAISLLEQIPSEKNIIISKWRQIGVTSQSAYDSQALLQLKKHYCDDKKCLWCRIGHKIVAKKIQ